MKWDRALAVVGLIALATAIPRSPARAGVIGEITANGYTFINFDGPNVTAPGTTVNGISNANQVVGFTGNGGTNFVGDPAGTLTNLAVNAGDMANGINGAGTVVGATGTSAFILPKGGTETIITPPTGATAQVAFGINDKGMIVGQYTNATGQMPGFILNGTTYTTIDSPTGPDTVNAQGINNNGLVVGFAVGTDGNQHGFTFDSKAMSPTFTPVADPTIPAVPGEPGATFVFSQILGINDGGLAVGYYGDSTTSQHGYLYDTITKTYRFLDDPAAQFTPGGVEVTQITGISNSGEIAGFYTTADGLQHSFIASPVPEPASLALLGLGLIGALGLVRRRAAPDA